MAWRLAKSLQVLRSEIRSLYPGTTVWDIGDAEHRASASDHNPNPAGVVCAIDVLADGGLDLGAFAEHVRTSGHPAAKYVIFNRRIASRSQGWRWRAYHGSNPHTTHVHVSVGRGSDGRSTGPYDDTSPWGLEGDDDMIGLKRGDSGQRVKGLQSKLARAGFPPDGGVDGDYGPATAKAVLKMRRAAGSGVDNGDSISGWAATQLDQALADKRAAMAAGEVLRQAKRAVDKAIEDLVANLPTTGAGGNVPSHIVIDLPDTITVPIEPAGDDD